MAGKYCFADNLRNGQERRKEMKNSDIKAMLDIASKIIEAAKAVLVEKPKKKKGAKSDIK